MKRNRYVTVVRLILCIECFLVLFGLACVRSGHDTGDTESGRFIPLDIYVDPGDNPLAVYQIEIEDTMKVSAIVGIEGGEHRAFRNPPHYDPAAIDNHRVILAAFSMSDILPMRRTRVATIHLLIPGRDQPGFTVRHRITAGPDGKSFAADIILVFGEES